MENTERETREDRPDLRPRLVPQRHGFGHHLPHLAALRDPGPQGQHGRPGLPRRAGRGPRLAVPGPVRLFLGQDPETQDLHLDRLSLRRPLPAGLRDLDRLAAPHPLPRPRPGREDPERAPRRHHRRPVDGRQPGPPLRDHEGHGQRRSRRRDPHLHRPREPSRLPAALRPGRHPRAGREPPRPHGDQGSGRPKGSRSTRACP